MLYQLQQMNESITNMKLMTQEMKHSSEINKHLFKELDMTVDIIKLKKEKREMEQLAIDYGKILQYMIESVADGVKRKEILVNVIQKLGDVE